MPQKHKNKPSIPWSLPRKEPPARPVRLVGVSDRPNGQHPSWRLSLLDLEHAGSWSWDVSDITMREIIAFLTEMERLTWTEVRAQTHGGGHFRHHPIPVEQLCAEAQRRLRSLRLDDLDELFEFRLASRRRLWGVLPEDGIFYVLWWDSAHRVYPTGPA